MAPPGESTKVALPKGAVAATGSRTAAPSPAAATMSSPGPGAVPSAATVLTANALAAGRSALDEWESKTLLAAYGVSVPTGAPARDEAEAVTVAARMDGPLAMKALGADIRHKTEAGLVVLGISGGENGAASVADSYRVLRRRAETAGVVLDRVLVEEMIPGNRELLVGMKRDPVFGPVVAFGLGGVLTEVLDDVAVAVLPLDERAADELPDQIRAKRLLGSFRGSPPVDRVELTKVILALARLAEDFPEIGEIEINPLLIAGAGPVAADALVILRSDRSPAIESAPPSRTYPLNLRAVLAPASVAIVGASDDIRKWGGSALRNMLDGGYTGTIYPVNPRAGVFFGVQAYSSLDDLPETPDLALLAVGADQVAPMLERCGRGGIPAAVALAAGFSEVGAHGVELERELVRITSESHMTLIGPNCMGLMSNERRLHATGFVALHPPPGKLSLISQSGSIGPGVVNSCERRGIGVDKFVSVGNEAVVSALDVLDYLRDDPLTESIMMYLEGIDDGRHFLEAARRTTSRKPVVVLRGGLTEPGRLAAASHTGALAGSAAVFRAAARQAGVVVCGTTQELVDLGASLAYLPLPKGRRVAVVTNGGGPGVLAADEVALNGLELARLPPDLLEVLDGLLPPFWSRRNPLDLVAAGFGDIGLRVIELVTRCESVDAVMALNFLGVPNTGDEPRGSLPGGESLEFTAWEAAFLERVAALMDENGKPIINVPDHPVGGLFAGRGRYSPVVLSSPRAAARALDRMAWYGRYRAVASG